MEPRDWLAVALIALGAVSVVGAFFPGRLWVLGGRWRFRNPDAVEPSDLAIVGYTLRALVAGILLIYMGITVLAEQTPEETAERCETIMAELRDVYAREERLPPVIRRAEELGVEIEVDDSGPDPPSASVREGDRYFGPLVEHPFLRDGTCEPVNFMG